MLLGIYNELLKTAQQYVMISQEVCVEDFISFTLNLCFLHQALELMTPKVHLNEDSRAKCHVRRGAALCKLGMLRPGLADFEAAFAIKPNDQQLQSDIEEVKLRLQESNEDSK